MDLTLQEQGYDVRRLKRGYEDLPDDASVLVLAAPRYPVTAEEGRALGAWLEGGGVLITDLPCGRDAIEALGFEGRCGVAVLDRPRVAVDGGGGVLHGVGAVGPAAPRRFKETPRSFVPLVFDEADVYMGVARVGDGAVYMVPADTVFSNGALDEYDNMRLAYNLFVSADSGGAVYFDEFHHGFSGAGQGPGGLTMVQALVGTPYGLFTVQLALAALLLLLNRHGLKKRRPRATLQATPLAFAGAAAGLYRRSGAYARSASRMLRITRRDLARRRGLPPDTALQHIADLFPQHDDRHRALRRLAHFHDAVRDGAGVSPDQAVQIARDIAWINQSFEEPFHAEF